MSEEVQRYLESMHYLGSTTAVWGGGTVHIRVSTYLGESLPPTGLVSSARAIVYRDSSVLVISQESGHLYILPGGRLEKGETPLDALHREVLEETGWTITDIRTLGCMHLRHLGEKPPEYRYPHPDSFWPIYTARAVEYKPEFKIPDIWVYDSEFMDIEEVKELPLDEGELLLLAKAEEIIRYG